jgi:hypothetical protein
MTKSRWLILFAYPACGLVLGLADPFLGNLARQWGTKPGMATALSVNLLLTLMAVALALAHRRLWAAWLGAAAMTFGFAAGLAVCYSAGIRHWSPLGLLSSIPPVLAAAAVGYAVIGAVAVLVAQACTVLSPRGAK